ncbi:MAG TPA: hypothetical protein VFF68_08730 [Anaerolineaceae bacterium]|nr:hypothetical protein [Anaerolineaceae bacterium]
MFEALMKMGGYRVDYLNRQAAGSPQALGFYVRGQLTDDQPYSRDAKRRLYTGLAVVQNELGPENLVSVYVDVNRPENLTRPAYVQLKEDLRSGLFRRVFTVDVNDLAGAPNAIEDLCKFYQEVGGFELLAFDDSGSPQSMKMFDLSCSQAPFAWSCLCLAA